MLSTQQSEDVLTQAFHLIPTIKAVADESETHRQLPASLAHTLAEAGMFQLYLPRSMGGAESSPLTTFQVIECLSKVDSAVGWCTMIANACSLLMGWLPADVGRELFGTPPDIRMAGAVRPEGRAYPVPGGYRVQGQWDFASGVTHANWVLCTSQVVGEGLDEVLETRSFVVPAASASIIDTWSVVGMCGTGSHDFAVDDVFVPTACSFSLADAPCEAGPLYHPRFFQIALWTATAATSLGIARGAIETFTDLATQKSSTMMAARLRDRPRVQVKVAEAEAIVSAARAYVIDAVGTAWDAICAETTDPALDLARARLSITHGMHEAVRAVDLIFHAAGTNALYRKNGLEQSFRDVHAAAQHGAGLPVHIENAGKILLGLCPKDVGW